MISYLTLAKKNKADTTVICSFRLLLFFCLFFFSALAAAQTNQSLEPSTTLNQLLLKERSLGCDKIHNRLQQVLCEGNIKIGVNDHFRHFGERVDEKLIGFEIDLARSIATSLGVKLELIPVNFTNRTQYLSEKIIDLILANMTHTVSRDQFMYFIRPHYYTSPTTVVGKKTFKVESFADLGTLSVCVQMGHFSNVVFSKNQIRMLMYETPVQLFDALKFGVCDFVAHDHPIVMDSINVPDAPAQMGSAFEEKFSFDQAPWGIGVEKSAADSLGKAVSLILANLHSSGDMIKFATRYGVQTSYLEEAKEKWSDPSCYQASGELNIACYEPAYYDVRTKSILAPFATKTEELLFNTMGWRIKFDPFSDQQSLSMLLEGFKNSVILLVATLLTSCFFIWVFFKCLTSEQKIICYSSKATAIFFLNAPTIFLLILGYLIASTVTTYSGPLALLTAAIVIGLGEGATGGYAMYEASKTLGKQATFLRSLRYATVRVRACLITSVQACPIAAFIGAPELLSVLTDITAISGERATTFTILALFYGLSVHAVVVISAKVFNRLSDNSEPHHAS